MRNLTVRRRKAFAGCAAKVKLYIEDENGEAEINGIKCRLLGKLKNKESATYEIDNESRKLFAAYDKLTKGFCNDFYKIPAGEDNVEITGVVHLNPFMGNPFYFDGVDDESLANRKQNGSKGKKIMIPLLIIGVIAGAVAGYYLSSLLF